MFLSTDEAKIFLGITGTEYDTEIEELIKDSQILLESLIGSPLEAKDYSKLVFFRQEDLKLYFKEININSITKISGIDYTGQENIDFIKIGLRQIQFINEPAEYTIIRNRVLIDYNAGYTEDSFPAELKLALKYITSGLWNTKENVGIKSCKEGLESCSYTDSIIEGEIEKIIKNFKKQPEVNIL